MGLLDILNGMQHGPRGERQPGTGGGGMSPLTMALLGLLAYKAVKSLGGSQPVGGQPPPGAGSPGGLGDILGGLFRTPGGTPGTPAGGLGNILGPNAGSVISNGLGGLVRDLQASGNGQAAHSWIGSGPNQEIAPGSLASAVGADTLDALIKQTGMPREQLLGALSQHLPGLVDQLTPNGKLPTADEAARMV